MTLDLDAIKARAEAATVCKRPWWEESVLAKALTMGDEPWDADYAYMAAMNPTLALELIAEVERLRGIVEEVKAFCSDPCTENCCESCDGQNEAYQQVLTILDALEGK